MDINEKKLRIDYLIAHKNNLWAGVIVLAGGLAGILLTINFSGFVISLHCIIKIVLVLIGSFFLVSMMIGLMNIHDEVNKIITTKEAQDE